MMNPLHTKEWIDEALASGISKFELSYRRTGRSTAQALRAIAWCINNPGQKLEIYDHFGTKDANWHLTNMIRDMVDHLGLQHIHFEEKDRHCFMIFENRERTE